MEENMQNQWYIVLVLVLEPIFVTVLGVSMVNDAIQVRIENDVSTIFEPHLKWEDDEWLWWIMNFESVILGVKIIYSWWNFKEKKIG